MPSYIGLYDFNILSEHQKAEAVWEHGVFLGDRVEGILKILLHQINYFYVETEFSNKANNETI